MWIVRILASYMHRDYIEWIIEHAPGLEGALLATCPPQGLRSAALLPMPPTTLRPAAEEEGASLAAASATLAARGQALPLSGFASGSPGLRSLAPPLPPEAATPIARRPDEALRHPALEGGLALVPQAALRGRAARESPLGPHCDEGSKA